jgi:putative transcriptional regulator
MRAFSIKLRVLVLSIVIAALIATLATSRTAQSTDLTTPSFLVATRDLQDPLFQHSVILMVPSTEPPLLAGLIINNPAKQRVRDLFPQVRDLKGPDETIYTGGPVELDDVPVLHQHRELSVIFRSSSAQSSATRVFDDVYVATGHDAIAAVLKDPRITDLRVISGKAQWLHDQLYGEVMAGAWYVIPAKADLIFSDPKELWATLVKGGDLEEARAGTASELNLPYWLLDGTNWQRRISPN